ncbi:MAG TPA: phosphotransferase [Actinomycetota bacterium]|nr:phosphotransferase [Actinomycetota bacterium]
MDRALSTMGSLLRPVDRERRLVLLAAGETWSPPDLPPPAEDADSLAWGRGASPSGTPVPRAVATAMRRELALASIRARPPSGWRIAHVHRLAPQRAGTGPLRRRVRRALLGGAIVELTRGGETPRLLDRVLDDPGVTERSAPRLSSGGAVVVTGRLGGEAVLVRLAPEGADGDPAVAAGALRALAGVPLVPRLLAEGTTLGISWTVETLRSGRRPDRLTDVLAVAGAGFVARLPPGDDPPTSLAEDLSEIGRSVPSRRQAIERLAGSIDVGDLPAVLRHGDLWAGNLLTHRGRLSGVIDWDAWHPRAVPGADLLELYASGARLRARRPLGEVWRERPWRAEAFQALARGHQRRFGLHPGDDRWEIVGVAWWAAKVAGTLRRLPERGADERWLADIVDPVLDALRA